MASNTKEIATDLSPFIKVYKDGTVERFFGSPHVPPSPQDPTTGVSSKDITISPQISARLYLPNLNQIPNQKLPILVYYHGGGFFLESAFSFLSHRYMNLIASESKALAVSVEYRLAPEHPLPAGYEDCWDALQWVASHNIVSNNDDREAWLINHGNFDKVFIGGDSAGGNIVHNIAMRAGSFPLNGGIKLMGAILCFPCFLSSNPVGSEVRETLEQSLPYKFWFLVYPSAIGGIDNPMINPFSSDAPSLSGLGCSKLMVCVAEKDELSVKGLIYVEGVKESGWKGEVELIDVEGEIHCFQISDTETDKAKDLIKRIALFIGD